MGASIDSGARSANETLDLLDALLLREAGEAHFVVVGHSFGAYLARGVAARHPERVAALALLSSFVPDLRPEPRRIIVDEGLAADLDDEARGDYLGYFLVRTRETLARFDSDVRPALGRYDGEAVERVMTDADLVPDPDSVPFDGPVLILAGRDDDLVGWRAQQAIVDRYPRAMYVLVADAGHAVIHERPRVVAAALADLLARIDLPHGGATA